MRKKLTVSGIIGHTQGVSNARRPPRKPPRKIYHSEPLCESSAPEVSTGVQVAGSSDAADSWAFAASCSDALSVVAAEALPENVNGSFVGGMHVSSLQLEYSTYPSRCTVDGSVTLKCCVKVTFCSHQLRVSSNISSTFSIGAWSGVRSPVGSSPEILSHTTTVGDGPPSGSWVL